MFSHQLNKEIVVFNQENLRLWREQFNVLNVEDPDEQEPNAALARESSKEMLNKNYTDGNRFLGQLKNTPGIFLCNFKQDSWKELEKFNLLHPTNQNILIRKASIQLNYRISSNLEPTDRQGQRKEYYDFCHLLWIILWEIDNNKDESNEQFELLIINLIKKSHIPIFGDLPDDLRATPKFYRLDMILPPTEKIMDDATLSAKERDEFDSQYRNLQDKITEMENGSPAVQTNLIKELVTEIDGLKAAPNFDIKFATTVLQQTNKLLRDPYNANTQIRYHDLANHADGKPTETKGITGLMLRFLGCLFLTAAFELTLFLIIPEVAVMITIPVYASVLIAIGLVKVGSSIIIHSDTYLDNGARDGLSLKMEKTVEQFERPGIGMRG